MVELNLLSIGFAVILISQSIVGILLDWLNFNRLRSANPEDFDGPITRDIHSEAGERRLPGGKRTFFNLARKAVRDTALISLIVSGALNSFAAWLTETGFTFIFGGVVFFLAVTLFFLILELPFRCYGPKRLGEEGSTGGEKPAARAATLAREWVPRMLVVGFLSWAVLFVIKHSPDWWWLWCFFPGVAIQFYLTVLQPSVIEPLSMQAVPISDANLLKELTALAQRTGLSHVSFYRMGGPQSRTYGAYCVGIGRIRRIFLSDGMLSILDPEEVLALVAHEIGHLKKRHITASIALGIGATFIVLFCTFLLTRWDYLHETFGIAPSSVYPALFLIAVFWRKVGFFFKPAYVAVLRKFELQADDFVVELMRTPSPLASALRKISEKTRSTADFHPLYAWFHLSHPPLRERVTALRNSA